MTCCGCAELICGRNEPAGDALEQKKPAQVGGGEGGEALDRASPRRAFSPVLTVCWQHRTHILGALPRTKELFPAG
jgi:hypothetical protein